MAAPYNDLQSKLEAAIKSLIDVLALTGTRGSTANTPVTVLTGLDDDTVALPKVVVYAEESVEEAVRDSGVFKIRAWVEIYSHTGDETLATHRTRVATVIDAIQRDDIASLLSAAVVDFFVYHPVQFMGPTADPEASSFRTRLEMMVVCCASDLA